MLCFSIEFIKEMEEHISLLRERCRVCGQKIKFGDGFARAKSVEDYSNVLFTVYDVDIEYESSDIYPKHLCSKCRRNLDRYKTKLPAPHLEAATFEPHTDDCSLCKKPAGHSRTPVRCHLRFMDDIMKRYNLNNFCETKGFKRTYVLLEDIDGHIVPKITLRINDDFTWSLKIFSIIVDSTHESLSELPKVLNDENIEFFVIKLSHLNICHGNASFTDICDEKLEIRHPYANSAIFENKYHVPLRKQDFKIIRHRDCNILCDSTTLICSQCSKFQASLRKTKSLMRKEKEDPNIRLNRTSDSSKANIKNLPRDQLIERLINVQKQKKYAIKKVLSMSAAINKLILKDGVTISSDQHSVCKEIMSDNECSFDEDSPQFLLWQQQKEQASKKDSRGMRWHPLIIRWCLSIYHTSPAAYAQISSKKLQFLKLPHVNTLKKFTNFTSPSSGFNPDILERLAENVNLETLPEHKKTYL